MYNIQTWQAIYKLTNLQTLTGSYLGHNHPLTSSVQLDSDVARLMDDPPKAFNTLQVAVLTFNDDGYNLHRMRCTGPKIFRKQDRRND